MLSKINKMTFEITIMGLQMLPNVTTEVGRVRRFMVVRCCCHACAAVVVWACAHTPSILMSVFMSVIASVVASIEHGFGSQ